MHFTGGSRDCEDDSSDDGASRAGFARIAMRSSVSFSSPPTGSFSGSGLLRTISCRKRRGRRWQPATGWSSSAPLREDRLVAVTLFGWAGGVADALFNISLPEGRDAATALLIEGAERLGTRDVSLLNIGGGVRSGDDVERAKQLFGASARPLLRLKQVFAPGRFRQLCDAAAPARKRPGRRPSSRPTIRRPMTDPIYDRFVPFYDDMFAFKDYSGRG